MNNVGLFWDTVKVIIRIGTLNYVLKCALVQYALRRFRYKKNSVNVNITSLPTQ